MAREIAFRDGARTVPDHVAAMLTSVDTWKYSYREAMDVANNRLLGDRLDKVQRDLIRDHFRTRLP